MNKKTRYLLALTITAGVVLSPQLALAADTAPSTTATTRVAARSELRKTNADIEITRRVTALNGLISKISAMKHVSADQKTTLTASLQNAISSLTALKTKIDGDTDTATLQADKQSIIASYRIFALLLPQINIMSHADAILDVATSMSTNDSTLQTKIQTLQTAGKNVSELQTLLSDRQAKIADAKAKAQTALTSVTGLTPEGYPGNKTTLTSARDMLKTARTDLKTAYTDLVQFNQKAKTL